MVYQIQSVSLFALVLKLMLSYDTECLPLGTQCVYMCVLFSHSVCYIM